MVTGRVAQRMFRRSDCKVGKGAGRHRVKAGLVALGLVLAAPASADPLPLPTTDFHLKANLIQGAVMDLVHSHGRMRAEITKPDVPGSVVSFIDIQAGRMVMLSAALPKAAVEVDLPPEYAVGALLGAGRNMGRSEVSGIPCDQWQVDAPQDGRLRPVLACITADGIVLRTETEIQGRRRTLYEVTALTLGPQDPELFKVPPGVKVVKIPKNALSGMLRLPGIENVSPTRP